MQPAPQISPHHQAGPVPIASQPGTHQSPLIGLGNKQPAAAAGGVSGGSAPLSRSTLPLPVQLQLQLQPWLPAPSLSQPQSTGGTPLAVTPPRTLSISSAGSSSDKHALGLNGAGASTTASRTSHAAAAAAIASIAIARPPELFGVSGSNLDLAGHRSGPDANGQSSDDDDDDGNDEGDDDSSPPAAGTDSDSDPDASPAVHVQKKVLPFLAMHRFDGAASANGSSRQAAPARRSAGSVANAATGNPVAALQPPSLFQQLLQAPPPVLRAAPASAASLLGQLASSADQRSGQIVSSVDQSPSHGDDASTADTVDDEAQPIAQAVPLPSTQGASPAVTSAAASPHSVPNSGTASNGRARRRYGARRPVERAAVAASSSTPLSDPSLASSRKESPAQQPASSSPDTAAIPAAASAPATAAVANDMTTSQTQAGDSVTRAIVAVPSQAAALSASPPSVTDRGAGDIISEPALPVAAAAAPVIAIGSSKRSDYILGKRLGRGHFAVVYEATYVPSQTQVAIKIMDLVHTRAD